MAEGDPEIDYLPFLRARRHWDPIPFESGAHVDTPKETLEFVESRLANLRTVEEIHARMETIKPGSVDPADREKVRAQTEALLGCKRGLEDIQAMGRLGWTS